jgi:putative FmdB family regulatory protein
MPLYEYECKQCGVRFERLQKMMDAPLHDCPECGGSVYRVIQPVGVIFKGSGFYVTDNKGKSSTGIPGGKKKDEDPKSGSAASGESTTPAPAPASGSETTAKD